jgi:septum formation protein
VSDPEADEISFILASASPRRKALLRSAGLSFLVEPNEVDESRLPGEAPFQYVQRMAEIKARAAARRLDPQASSMPILAADTIVVVGGDVLGKPADVVEARRMLERLSGRVHQVITGFCLLFPDGSAMQQEVTTDVRFKALYEEEIQAYLLGCEWQDKAGGYAIQGRAAYMIEGISGSYTNVVGLPLCEVVETLRQVGIRGTRWEPEG